MGGRAKKRLLKDSAKDEQNKKVFWLVIVAIGLAGAFWFVSSSINDWANNPTGKTVYLHLVGLNRDLFF